MEFDNTNHTVQVGEEIILPSNDTHVVYTVSESPSCWMYIFMNTTEWNNETVRNWILHPGKRDTDMLYIVVFENEYKNSNRKLEW